MHDISFVAVVSDKSKYNSFVVYAGQNYLVAYETIMEYKKEISDCKPEIQIWQDGKRVKSI